MTRKIWTRNEIIAEIEINAANLNVLVQDLKAGRELTFPVGYSLLVCKESCDLVLGNLEIPK